MYTKIEACRICGNPQLALVLDLGIQALTGVFPRSKAQQVTSGPLKLVKCDGGKDSCGLLQLEHSYDSQEMYGENYGYRSGLNASMVEHLRKKVDRIRSLVDLERGDLVVDIGSNDGTTLSFYGDTGLTLIGVDPTAGKFSEYYPGYVQYIADFFSARLLDEKLGGRKAKVITSFSMFYDLQSPLSFVKDIYHALAPDGIWTFEQSYMPTMIEMNAYDTVCHEHLEYYALKQIKWLADQVGFTIVDVEFNDINGGSFSVTVSKSPTARNSPFVAEILDREVQQGYDTLDPYLEFARCVEVSRCEIIEFVRTAVADGKSISALGASTKGNVLLQYCGLASDVISLIGEVNPDKFGSFSPGTLIPIVPEAEVLASRPDYLLVLPWHFRKFFMSSSLFAGRTLVFPLPILEVVPMPA